MENACFNSRMSQYLNLIKNQLNLQNWNKKFTKIYVLNNSSCDMDSFISSFLLSFAKNISENLISFDSLNEAFKLNENVSNLYIPLMNCKKGELKNRLDIAYLLNKFNVEEECFIYIDDNYFMDETSQVILVDHHILDCNLFNNSQVVTIYDHHNDKESKIYYQNITKKTIKFPLGSCSTLILMDFYVLNEKIRHLFSYLADTLFLLTAILLDTSNFKSELYGNRWEDMDLIVFNEIIKLNSGLTQENITTYYTQLNDSKFDVNLNLNLGLEKLINKDKKNFVWGNVNAIWSSLQVPFKSIIKKFGWGEFISNIEEEIKNKNNFLFLSISNYADEKQKLCLLYHQNLKSCNIEEFDKYLNVKMGENFLMIERKKNNENVLKIKFNAAVSRKVLEPILKLFFENSNLV